MKKIIFITLIMLIGVSSFSQDTTTVRDTVSLKQEIEELEKEIKYEKIDSWGKLCLGLMSHLIASTQILNGFKSDGVGGFIMYNAIGLPFDVISIVQFSKLHKKKKKLKELKSELDKTTGQLCNI